MSLWITAQKAWNAKRDKYTIPHRGTAEYAEVMKIVAQLKSKATTTKRLLKENRK